MAEIGKNDAASAKKDVKKTAQAANIINKINDAFAYVQVIYAEKGVEPFKVPVLIVLSIVFCLYFFVYSKIEPQINDITSQIDTFRSIADNLDDYMRAKSSITEFKKKLPMYKDREDWLNYLIISTAKKNNIELESLSPQKISEKGDFAIASRDVETTVEYDVAGMWIAELENAPVFLRITFVSIDRIAENPALVKVKMTVSTLFIKD